MFVIVFLKVEDLLNVMEIRGYNFYVKRIKYRLIIFIWRDIFLVFIVVWVIIYVVLVDK